MLIKSSYANEQRPKGNRILDANTVLINLPKFIAELKNEQKWEQSDRNVITVFKSDTMRMVLIALQKGATMSKHKTDGMLNIQLLEGEVAFVTDEASYTLSKSMLLALHQGVSHSVIAKEEAIFLLTTALIV